MRSTVGTCASTRCWSQSPSVVPRFVSALRWTLDSDRLIPFRSTSAVIVNHPMVVGVFGGVPAAVASGFAVGSLVATTRRRAVERAWLAIGLLVFSVVLVVLVDLLWL